MIVQKLRVGMQNIKKSPNLNKAYTVIQRSLGELAKTNNSEAIGIIRKNIGNALSSIFLHVSDLSSSVDKTKIDRIQKAAFQIKI